MTRTAKTFERGEVVVRCESCGRPVELLPIDDTDETIPVSGRSIHVAFRTPDLVGYATTFARRVHACPKRRVPSRRIRKRSVK